MTFSTFEEYELACEQERKRNKQLLDEFSTWLKTKQLTKKTINNHLTNVDLYINDFLLYEDPISIAEEGIPSVNMYFGYWFIKKIAWGSGTSISSGAASLKKFYGFLSEKGLVSAEDLAQLKAIIKENMSEWQATLIRYDDPDIVDMGEVWGH